MSEQEEKRSIIKDTTFELEKDGELTLNIVEVQTRELSHIYQFWGSKLANLREYSKNCQLDLDIFIATRKQEAIMKKCNAMSPAESARFKKDISGTASKELMIITYQDEYREQLNQIFHTERQIEELEKALKALEIKSFGLGAIGGTLRREWATVK